MMSRTASQPARLIPPLLMIVLLAGCGDSPAAPRRAGSPDRSADRQPRTATGAVYTMTNASSGNAVVAFSRASDGSLAPVGTFLTGGAGSGGAVDPLQSEYSLRLTADHRWLLAVNAGSNDVSLFRVNPDATLELTARAPSAGTMPVSIAVDQSIVYVLNAGSNTVSGLRLTGAGLTPIPHSARPLSAGAAGASTIDFSPDGAWIVVTERDANRLETFPVRASGRVGSPVVTASHGATPFGFAITARNQPIVSEANGAPPDGAVSSYDIASTGSLNVVSGSLDSGGMAACWVSLTSDQRIAFVVNSGSNAIASFSVASNAALTRLNASAASTGAGTAPIDLDLAGRFLFVLEAGTGSVGAYTVGSDGSLSLLGVTPAGGASSGMQGLAAF